MNKIILCRGIPASGKSTWAEQEHKEHGAKVFNKDKLRKLAGITTDNWSKEKENKIVEQERDCVAKAMRADENYIIVDNTHLGPYNQHIDFYRGLAEEYGYKFEIKDFYIDRKTAIERDKNRENSVGEKVINKMISMHPNGGYPRHPVFKEYDDSKANAYIFDIDGTLAFMDDKRSPYDYSKVGGDRSNGYLIGLINTLKSHNKIFIVSGRDAECKKETEQWLKENMVSYDAIYMKKKGNKRKDSIVKKEIYNKYLSNYNILGVFDDRNQVIDMWRLELGLPCYQVWYGTF